jgi:hypothetical protein
MIQQAQQAGGRHLNDRNRTEATQSTAAAQQEAEAVAKAIGAPKRGILKYGGPLARVTSNQSEGTNDEAESPEQRFALPIGYLTTESAPRADLAMQSPSIVMLQEDWDEPTPPRARSPMPVSRGHMRSGSDAAMTDDDEDETSLGVKRVVEHRRPSTRETTPWLADILRDKPTRRAGSHTRSASHGRSPSR